MNFAVIKTGGKQYKVAANDVVKIEKLVAEPGDVVTFDQVLMVGNGDDVTVGAPLVAGASVAGHFVDTKKSRTVLIVKKHRRQHFDRRNGHRQMLSTVRIGEILLGGAKTTLVTDEKVKAQAAAKAQASAMIAEPVAQTPKPVARKAPAKKAAVKIAAPKPEAAATETQAAKPAKKAPAKKAAAKDTTEAKAAKPAAKKAPAKKAAAKKADKE
ncbi:MAG: 50S ribosomal protein L21 [Devosia sp.]